LGALRVEEGTSAVAAVSAIDAPRKSATTLTTNLTRFRSQENQNIQPGDCKTIRKVYRPTMFFTADEPP
jgi:hypothetical protein